MRVSEICVKRIRVNQGLGVYDKDKSKVEISQNYVAFSEYMNFTTHNEVFREDMEIRKIKLTKA